MHNVDDRQHYLCGRMYDDPMEAMQFAAIGQMVFLSIDQLVVCVIVYICIALLYT